MTDKQIIIDGVDVSGCKCYNPNIKMDCLLYPLQSDACKNNPNCHYKLYKRKEQECDKWQVELAYKKSELRNIEEKIKPLMERPDDLDYYDLEWIVWAFADDFKQLKRQHEADKGLITVGGKQLKEALEAYDQLKAKNEELNKEVQYLKSEIERIGK